MGIGDDRRYNHADLQDILDLAGIPEFDVKRTDEDGRVEFGHLHVEPQVRLAPETRQKLDAFMTNDSDFALTWNRKKRMRLDNTWSGYAQSLANRMALASFTDQEIIDVLTLHRREHGDPGKQGPKALPFFKATIGKARKAAAEQKEREQRRQEREAKRCEVAEQESKERVLIAEVAVGELEARKILQDYLELDVRRLVQVGNDTEPSYRLELEDGRVVQIPSLACVTSFAAFNRYIWRYLRTALPGKAKRQWRAVIIALAKLIVVEDTGLGKIELMRADLGEYFAGAERRLFERYPADKYPDGPPRTVDGDYDLVAGWLVRAESEAEFRVALGLLALPRRGVFAIPGIYHLEDKEAETARVLFTGPPLFDYLRDRKNRKFDVDEMNRRLSDAGFRYRDTLIEHGHRLRRVWTGLLADAAVDDHKYLRTLDVTYHSELRDRLAKERLQ